MCQREPRADHLAGWLAPYELGRIGKDDVAAVFRHIVVITKLAVVLERRPHERRRAEAPEKISITILVPTKVPGD
ncbi:MAG TPA: hypothetical protein VLM11_20985 [Streptosporangiaceae bacterium]|nr:hypothetical protein [Streptosporangiaceae bacterium]